MTNSHSMVCRVCGNKDVQALPLGAYAPFFRLRVNIRNDKYLLYSRAPLLGGPEISVFSKVLKRLGKIFGSAKDDRPWTFRTLLEYCDACQSVLPAHEWPFEDLRGLYHDYRSATYNRDRISVEPSYAAIVKDVGNHPSEIVNRNSSVEAFLRKNVDYLAGTSMLDFGGSDGRFLPPIIYERYSSLHIFDPSEAPLHPSIDRTLVSKVSSVKDNAYDFVACMHVLEHVGNPRAFLADAFTSLRTGGLMYVEIPVDLTDEWLHAFEARLIDNPLLLHEHLNMFGMKSVPVLAKSLGAEMIDAASDVVDFGWAKARIGRFLVRKLN